MKKSVFIILAALTVSFLSASCIRTSGNEDYEKTSIVKVGDTIPEFTVTDKDGAAFSSSELAGKSVLIFFFQTTCPDCQKVIPVIDQLCKDTAGDNNYVVLPINRGQTTQAIEDYFEEKGYTMNYYLDPVRITYDKFATSYVPRVYVVGPDGKVTWMAVEKLPSNADSAEELLAKMEAAQAE